MGEPSGQPDVTYVDSGEEEPQYIIIDSQEEEEEEEEEKPSPQLGPTLEQATEEEEEEEEDDYEAAFSDDEPEYIFVRRQPVEETPVPMIYGGPRQGHERWAGPEAGRQQPTYTREQLQRALQLLRVVVHLLVDLFFNFLLRLI
ncbi:histone H3.v1-like [Pseudophryne corroboree]|uniref:histone H3.v1-like n=1 Tax=Pseudophryne corroboree TaxID=495146 RepID=UPI003081EC35